MASRCRSWSGGSGGVGSFNGTNGTSCSMFTDTLFLVLHCSLYRAKKKTGAGSPAVCDKWVEKNTMQLVYSVLTGCKQNNMSIKTKTQKNPRWPPLCLHIQTLGFKNHSTCPGDFLSLTAQVHLASVLHVPRERLFSLSPLGHILLLPPHRSRPGGAILLLSPDPQRDAKHKSWSSTEVVCRHS